ncbi:tRNA synthetases class I (E and Q) catalytic domain family protein [Brugia pahangi]
MLRPILCSRVEPVYQLCRGITNKSIKNIINSNLKEFLQLIKEGHIYACYETKEELDIKRKLQLKHGLPPVYDKSALLLTEQEKFCYEQEGRKPHFRFKLDRNEVVKWNDEVKGEINIATSSISDLVVFQYTFDLLNFTFISFLSKIHDQSFILTKKIINVENAYGSKPVHRAASGLLVLHFYHLIEGLKALSAVFRPHLLQIPGHDACFSH